MGDYAQRFTTLPGLHRALRGANASQKGHASRRAAVVVQAVHGRGDPAEPSRRGQDRSRRGRGGPVTRKKYVPRRGDVVRIDFQPQKGHEQAGRRPALVLSPTDYNRTVGLAVVCPITSEKKGYPWEVEIPDNPFVSGVVLSDQLKSLDWRERHAEFICTPEEELLVDVVEKAITL